MQTGLAGKGVVVTGASGGIGGACARAFASEGAKVLVHYHRGAERAAALAAEIGGAATAQADLTVEADVDRLFAAARTELGSVDVCAAVAGVWPAEDVPLVGAPARTLGGDDPPEPDGHLPHRARVPARGRP